MIDGLLAALGFLTRVPVPARVFERDGAMARSLPWYPLVGALIGATLCALAWCLRDAAPLLAAAIVLAAWVWLGGGLHLDGLADSADAWVGGLGDRARTLAIMKDPRSGPAAVVAVVLALLLKFAALASLPAQGGALLWLAPLLARTALVAAFASTPYVRTAGLGTALAGARRAPCVFAIALVLAAALATGAGGAIAVLAAAAAFALWRRACMRRLGGMTGDTCGALAELAETAVLVVLALWVG